MTDKCVEGLKKKMTFKDAIKECQKLKTEIKKYYADPLIENGEVVLYHGTDPNNVDKILREGLKGGDNQTGGTHGVFPKPTLFLAQSEWVAKKYGEPIEVRIPLHKFKKMGFDTFNDGVGDRVYVIEGEENKWNKPLISSKYLDYDWSREEDD